MTRRAKAIRASLYLILSIAGILYIFPFVWMVLSSLKLNKDLLAVPIHFLPPVWSFSNYPEALHYGNYDFPRYFLNSAIVLVFSVTLLLAVSTTGGYGFAKYRFRGNEIIFTFVLATMLIPLGAIVVPLFVLMRQLGWQNSYLGLIVPEGLSAFGVFLMRQFFYSVPTELIESARIDGANEYLIFLRISVPLSRTAIFSLIIFHSQYVWNLLFWPLVLVSNPRMLTLPQGIAMMTGVYETPYQLQLAVSVIACIPLVLLYLFLSRYFVRGIALTGLKQ